jgi:hypothetical protein
MTLPPPHESASAGASRALCIAERLADILDPRPQRWQMLFAMVLTLTNWLLVLTKWLLAAVCLFAAGSSIVYFARTEGPELIDALCVLGRRLGSAAHLTEAILRSL